MYIDVYKSRLGIRVLNYSANAIMFLWNDVGSSTNQATVVCSQTSYVNYHVVHAGVN